MLAIAFSTASGCGAVILYLSVARIDGIVESHALDSGVLAAVLVSAAWQAFLKRVDARRARSRWRDSGFRRSLPAVAPHPSMDSNAVSVFTAVERGLRPVPLADHRLPREPIAAMRTDKPRQ